MLKTWPDAQITLELLSFPIAGQRLSRAARAGSPEDTAVGTAPGLVGLRGRTSEFGIVFGNEQRLDRFSHRPPVCPFMRPQ